MSTENYSKIMRNITSSTICNEPIATRWIWVCMIATANQSGDVFGSVPGIARIYNVSVDELESALKCFLSPDPHSRTKEADGVRIEVIDGGWRLINFAKYHSSKSVSRREYMRDYMRQRRDADKLMDAV